MPMIEAKLDEVLANQTKMQKQLDAVQSDLVVVKDKQGHVIETQKQQGTKLLDIERVSLKAKETANEAKQLADSAQHEVTQMTTAIQQHVSGVEATLKGHASQLFEVKDTLGEQNKVLAEQTGVLAKIHDSETARTARDIVVEKFAEKQNKFVMWAVPLGFSLMTGIVGLTVWAMTHLR